MNNKSLAVGFSGRYGIALALGAVVLGGCVGGDTDGGKAKDQTPFQDDTFVSSSDTTGTIHVEVNDTELTIGETSGFHVQVDNANGEPVPNINIACDSEVGVAIIEPLRGFELTDEGGFMSGRIGCERPGSFQFLCRLTTGANLRDFVSIRCKGDVPAGFQGFSGAAGGGLGGGVQINDDGDVRIVEIGFHDDGNLSASDNPLDASVDVVQTADCDTSTAKLEPEPFFDTYINLKVENNLTEKVQFQYLTYSIPNADTRGNSFTSQQLGLTRNSQSTLDANGDVKNIVIPVFKAYNGGKYFGNPPTSGTRSTQIDNGLGLRTVTVNVFGATSSGKPVKISAQTTASFSNFDRCNN